jgi:SNF2 family DNA or RNA helicase
VINKKVVAAYLSRQMDNHDWMKKLGPLELRMEFYKELKEIPGFSKLWVHQLVCYLLVTTLKRFMLHIDMGGGKTSIVLFSILERKLRGDSPRAIVFVPYISSVDTWIEEAKERTPDLKLVPLLGNTIQNERRLEERDGDVFVICYASAVAMLAEDDPRPSKRKKRKQLIDPNRTRKVFEGFDTFVADEIHKCSNIGTLTYRMCRAISRECEYGMGLSGTPFGKDVEDIWSQFYLIDFGETLGETKGLFQEAFFNEKKNFFSGFNEYKFDKKKMPLLSKVIKHNSIHYAASEMHDLPQKRYIKHKLALPTAMEGYVSIAAAQFIEAIRSSATDRHRKAEASYLQLRQLASGFMTVDGENNTKVKVSFDTNPKLDYLEEKIDGMPYGCKMVVFHHFVYTNQLISERLTKLKIKHARVWSGQKDVIGELKRFRDDQNCTILVLNDQSGSSSLNLQHANYMFFFEEPDSPINRQQGEKRIWRPGQTKPVYYIDPFMEGTVDERIFFANQQGKKLLDELLRGTEKLK